MTIKQQIDSDLKIAMLAGEKQLVTTLRGLKSAILYVEVAKGIRDVGLTDTEVIDVLAKEAKKRQESVDMYEQGGNDTLAAQERQEKQVIEQYLPAQLTDAELSKLVDSVIADLGTEKAQMGAIITEVKTRSSGQADGGRIAQIVKNRLSYAAE